MVPPHAGTSQKRDQRARQALTDADGFNPAMQPMQTAPTVPYAPLVRWRNEIHMFSTHSISRAGFSAYPQVDSGYSIASANRKMYGNNLSYAYHATTNPSSPNPCVRTQC